MALKLYNPKTQSFTSITPSISDLPFSELLLLNILIELQAQSEMIAASNPGIDTIQQIRTDVAAEI